jgi:ribose 5-phosphate isomerase B
MKYFVATDHAGIAFKTMIIEMLNARGHEVINLGPDTTDRVDYPDYAKKLCGDVLVNKGSRGILICGSGIGMSMAANKVEGIRAALVHDAYSAGMARAHNDANVMCIGARIVGPGVAESILDSWLSHEFEGGRHADRIAKLECC